MPAERLAGRQAVAEMPHQRTDTEDAIDSGDVFDQTRMIGRGVRAELEHITENREPPPAIHRPRLQTVQRRGHARRIAIEAVTDQRDAGRSLLHAATGHDTNLA